MTEPPSQPARQALSLLVSPAAKGAFFDQTVAVATAELAGMASDRAIAHRRIGAMDFLDVEAAEAELPELARLACIHGVFQRQGEQLLPLATAHHFALHEDFVFGSKYRGKTHELLTQLLINTGLRYMDHPPDDGVKLLDPMCGRGTTLLWAMRYGMRSKGIEQDPAAPAEVRRHLKKWCKLHRQKHRLDQGSISRSGGRGNSGRFLEFEAAGSDLRIISGDASNARALLNGERFELIVSDLPYGIQHLTSAGARNPLDALNNCAAGWRDSLKPGGAIVLAFNANQPRRKDLIAAFAGHGLQAQPFSVPHRMSESIVRDVLVLKQSNSS